jgi:hypothetical protein
MKDGNPTRFRINFAAMEGEATVLVSIIYEILDSVGRRELAVIAA